ncbi:MAG: glutamine-hydrolyzing GMP synthase [Candidatus Omnitrophica bacterium CG11_big_fil_rev_8_21_14_0_20_45_26]|uniref:GMP synthase [glutamine-hydrolyzing] n=1 Tax=Candidatus Abzuiibacterium crystallinum TaxID=1974748 RepID=A0A2H0LNM0_9BACT|nr:MAG: glutamine-hydrolyzing GMP synthase [Candidatus Omnitrophica bacterium CG11_big_fil_rev_8_21_14_0_20_45_26]PIW65648.1 MAG: glutamine-hydrolyzing GMP synthase [Candidatus Omnitrophica bacterium CG12_big_fil_rev_8_21_14_0_65_45_16]
MTYTTMHHDTCLVLDFGSQYTQLIARRIREKKVFSVVHPYHLSFEKILEIRPRAIILSGSPANVYQKNSPIPDPRIFSLGVPILGICYGLQVVTHLLGGKVKKVKFREYGHADLMVDHKCDLFAGLPKKLVSWMSHGDQVVKLPKHFKRLAHTSSSPVASFYDSKRKIYGVQFHPEVVQTPLGHQIIGNFLFRAAKFKGNWTPASFIEETVRHLKLQIGKEKVILGLSGGVDSAVAAILLHKAIGKQLTCIFVDNGVLRLNERKKVEKVFRGHYHINLKVVDASKLFLKRLQRVTDPERKRKMIGRTFIEVFEKETKKLGKVPFLAQGTLYPDRIESVSVFGGPTSMIKSHHNVGGLPKKMRLKLVEPLADLFKDEVRAVGRTLKIPEEMIARQPFPGPGLAVRIVGAVTKERLDLLRAADDIIVEEIKKANLYYSLWQSFGVLLPIKSVGVMGDERTYESVLAVRAVQSQDGMTADWARLPEKVLARISNRIINEVSGINRVCYDISSKPPATIEWE